jgi:hypothetical protein
MFLGVLPVFGFQVVPLFFGAMLSMSFFCLAQSSQLRFVGVVGCEHLSVDLSAAR